MFEGQPQTEVEALMKGNNEFRQLYQRHKELDKQVLDAELGVLPVDDLTLVQTLVSEHQARTGSPIAARLLADWERACRSFIKVMPRAYKKVLAELAARSGAAAPASEPVRVAAAPLKVSA